ncbi:hypothetical protein [Muriicola soli]|uniref:Membrane metalloprotease n=1 Tax=Muriicola soli TaxID=2507538 RepID=A0A411EAX8_9FLAO|nr:hypothetical protein [Muriicola soli]QBA64808.1 hypothetical protein EQY75_09890 [Muriicola soli]
MRKKYYFFLIGLFLLAACTKDSNGPGGNDPDPIDKSANLLATGDSANDILTNETFTTLLIEIGYVTGFQPSAEAMNNFQAFLQARTFKQDIQVQYLELPSPNENDLSLQEIADLESENRTAYNEGSTLAIYIYFADAPADTDDPQEGTVTLGAVYRNTSMVIYESTVRELGVNNSQVTIADVETAALNHEFGHLLGLVDLGSPPVNAHEDPNAEHHCDINGCLMRAELQFGGGLLGMMNKRVSTGKAAVPGLDDECIADLQANGGK